MGNQKDISPEQKLYNLPINAKTNLISWFSIGSLAVVVIFGGFILRNGLKNKRVDQVKSQLAVTDIEYNIKINQMGFGFRGQSDNSAIITAATNYQNNQQIPTTLRTQIKNILQNEIKARQIEYATLVGTDKKIIVSANQERTGQTFDPNNLVSQALKTGTQIKSSEIVTWSEIVKEKPPLPEGFKEENALIRYTVTPVKDSQGKEIIGALISGDIVNQKLPIAQNSVEAFTDNQGYSAVYLRESTGEYTLATSFLETIEEGVGTFVPLSDRQIIEKAVTNLGEIVTAQTKIDGESYTLAAKAIPNNQREAIAVIIYGSLSSSSVLLSSLLAQAGLAVLVMGIIIYLTRILGKAIAEPIQDLQQVTQEFAEGNMTARATVYSNDEVGLLGSTFNVLADSIETNEKRLREDAKRSRILKEIAFRIGEVIDSEGIYQAMVDSARDAVECDRAIYYIFNEQWQGKIVAESLKEGFSSALGAEIYDPCFAENYVEKYQQGRIQAIADIEAAGLTECHLSQLQPFEVKANLVVPVLRGEVLTGLLIAHQCHNTREWEDIDIDTLEQIANQSGNALEKINLLKQQQIAQENERQAKENLQHRALELLMEVDPVSQGDLTIRARVKEDEIGTIADSYNATIESLRKLVTQVKASATLVSNTTTEKEVSVQELSQGASEQTTEISTAIERINAMANSIKVVATNAEEAEIAVRQASATVKIGDEVMNRTVDGFRAIRETVAETAKKVKRLGESSQKISKVVNLISSFADQTNLLALNASIEAAHAGEEGRGFAVVADEVRSLARQSAEATAEIESLVAEIQSETNEVVAAMESGTEQVVVGTKLVDETRSSLTQIADVSSQIDSLVRAIAEATVEQSQDSEVVTKTMTQVAAISQRTATEAEEVSDSFKELLTVAQKLQESVAQFKVN
ncbi:Methyl-accepting chemotaxis sensory transducer with GAF sensor [Hyella patelloides LEGE 07179]|uniref:Methyl-accepting chemotaxis sensory transducer with GAF sensor n=1 Tax=Hyella patelloides LEGE 07179 TaxID=945734 RepID=A0A563W4J6_9CYAN|nr:methyl-accepting chemotaxis protein [Hyella patelloides]VEP18595.1 Methyl-accepting chemotaxis sensory transducer with GAF sensor [Hyella patelloides LEGE 07179]